MDEKELMIPLELGYVEEAEEERTLLLYEVVHLKSHILSWSRDFSILKTQVAERNENQIGGWTVAGRCGLLWPVWQETETIPRCNEGTSAAVLRFDLCPWYGSKCFEPHRWAVCDYTEVGIIVGTVVYDWLWKNISGDNYNTAPPHCSNKCLFIRICCELPTLSLQLHSTPTLLSMTLIVRDDIIRFTSCAPFFLTLTHPSPPKEKRWMYSVGMHSFGPV